MNVPGQIGRFAIVRRLGRSMSEVYLATDTVENRQVALKLIRTEGDSINRLVIEAERRGAAIQKEMRAVDPRIIEIYDFGDADGFFFVAMQYVEGRNLAEVLAAENVMDPIRAAAIALEVCEQLAKFHRWHSVVHGDIKPSNIHIGHNETVRLLDFGIARTLRANHDATLHQFGSPSYCSPERLERCEVDQQSDLWAVGATLYEMLAGSPPFQAENTRKLEALIRSGRPPRALPASCPRSLGAIVNKALAPQPSRRYGSAGDLQADLQSFLEHRPTQAELERRSGWGASITMETAREYFRKATRTVRRARRRIHAASLGNAVAWFAVGMTLWIGGNSLWQTLAANRNAPAVAGEPDLMLPMLYTAAADKVLDAYQSSADPSLHDFDWQKAEICLARAVDLGKTDERTLGRLALSRGYAMLERLSGGQYSDQAAVQMRAGARDFFANAALQMPHDPAPHLALARLYVYSMPNLDHALAEFNSAEGLGAVLGRREVEQIADAYRVRAEEAAAGEDWTAAEKDAREARRQYQRIPGFDQVDTHLRELDRIHPPAAKKSRRQGRWR
jgi:hypothetical protein